MRLRAPFLRLFATAALLAAPLASAHAATITIVNMDGAGEGFNDPTAAAPVGGNPGTTIGQQRLNVFQQAANTWGAILPSAVTIFVQAQFDPLSCNATSAVLGSAGPITFARDFTGAEVAGTWYHIALANKMAGVDLSPSNNDINATFNSNLGQPGCLTGVFFYYGFDHNEGSNVDLLAVVLHELGHGLGFSSGVSLSTGQLLSGFPTAYDRHLRDLATGMLWPAMSDAQRLTATTNPGKEVWDGTAVNVKSSSFLGHRPQVVVSAPPVVAGTYTSGSATFGAPLTVAGVTASVVLANDGSGTTSDACSALINGGAVAGKICMVDRGTCSFNTKAANAQAAGAVGVIIVNNAAGLAPELGGTDPSITIPVTSMGQTEGNNVKAQLGGGVTATLRLASNKLAGADDANRVLVYTPNPNQPGSSVSHWDVSAFPNLLMEPIINPDLTNVDLTRYAFEDIGWLPHTTAVEPVPVAAMGPISSVSPNPFSNAATISFALGRPVSVDLDVYDVNGRLVKRLARNRVSSGSQSATWDGTDADGRRVGPGVYLYRLRAGDQVESRRMVLLH